MNFDIVSIIGTVGDVATAFLGAATPDTATGWLGLVAAVHALAVAIVNLTPTPKDNEILAKVYRGVEVVAGLLSRKAKQ